MIKLRQRVQVTFSVLFIAILLVSGIVYGQHDARQEVNIPDIPGYKVLKGDFHMHTVFSDGNVWPPVRAKEAWLNGLDAFAITDHIEYLPHKDDVTTGYNRSFELALPSAESRDLILIRGSEITRDMPPGHINAIFLQDANLLHIERWEDAVKAAYDQGAFIFWNHPGWKGQQPDGIEKWYDEHTELVNKGWIRGIEIVNGSEYYPEAHRWCLEKNLTMMGSSDVHDPIQMAYDYAAGDHRPMTLVLARDASQDSIKEALFAGRTVVYWDDSLAGKPEYLEPIFNSSVTIKNPDLELTGRSRQYLQIHNAADIPFELVLKEPVQDLNVPGTITLHADRTVMFGVRGKSNDLTGKKTYEIAYRVKNLLVAPDEGLPVTLKFTVTFQDKR